MVNNRGLLGMSRNRGGTSSGLMGEPVVVVAGGASSDPRGTDGAEAEGRVDPEGAGAEAEKNKGLKSPGEAVTFD